MSDAAPPPDELPVAVPAVVEPPGPPLVWPAFATLALAFVGMMLGGCFTGILLMPPAAVGAPDLNTRLMQSSGFMLSAMAVSQLALLITTWKAPAMLKDVGPAGWQERVAWRAERLSIVQIVLAAIGTQAAGALVLGLLTLGQVEGGILKLLASMSRSSDPSTFAWLLLVGAIAPGAAEELAFRGVLQTRLIERWGPVRGIAITALVFGAWHLDVRQGLAAVAMGLWLGWCAFRQRTTVNVVFAHMLNNALAFFLTKAGGNDDADGSAWLFVLTATAIVAACTTGMWWLTKKKD